MALRLDDLKISLETDKKYKYPILSEMVFLDSLTLFLKLKFTEMLMVNCIKFLKKNFVGEKIKNFGVFCVSK